MIRTATRYAQRAVNTHLPQPVKKVNLTENATEPVEKPKVVFDEKRMNTRMLGYRLIIMSIPLLAVSGFILYKRRELQDEVVLGEEQRKQIGFISEEGIPIKFSDLEDNEDDENK
ncbi:hypothetical protein V1512DRAFT_245700 [Lipomyces arxii]|uniref:uncharacterized protein n=1 Tax=Lipomyces arxii TaxID=56418 RepID=UPI0034CEF74F